MNIRLRMPLIWGANLALFTLTYSGLGQAACTNFDPTSGQTVICNSAPPNPTTTPIQAAVGSTNVLVNILTGSMLNSTRTLSPVVVRIASNSQINNSGSLSLTGGGGTGTNRGAALLATDNGNVITNNIQGLISTTGAYNDGMAANGSGNTLINNGVITTSGPNAYGMTASWGQTNTGQSNNSLINTGSVTTGGSNARATSILGQNGSITNSGTLLTTGNSANAVYMQGNGAQLINTGFIHTMGLSDAVFSNTAGSNFTATLQNLAGGQIISDQGAAIRTLNGATKIINAGLLQGGNGTAINGGNGNISLTLQSGSTIIGLANGGGGTNQVLLQDSGSLTNSFTNFQILYMQGTNWSWQGSGDFQNSFIQTGAFTLQNSFSGNVTIAEGASLLIAQGAQPSITPSSATNAPITVTNSGTIDIGMNSTSATETLTILGNYVGAEGALNLKTVLGSDSSPSNLLIIAQGAAAGTTYINISNLNGDGGPTTNDGILVVQAINGASTDTAFTLGSPVAVGPYEYLLFKGGRAEDSSENWYLRSAFVSTPGEPILTPPDLPPPTSGATIQSSGVFYRVETALYSAIEPVIKQTMRSLLGTFHERRGGQSVLSPAKTLSASWLRMFGQETRQGWAGTVSPKFKGSDTGFQMGLDLLSIHSASNARDSAGILGGYAHTQGAVTGNALGWNNYKVGHLKFDDGSLGIYWTHMGPSDWYLDTVLMYTWFNGAASSNRNIGIDIRNENALASLEGGYPIALFPSVKLEPQGQLIWQSLLPQREKDGLSVIYFQQNNNLTGRLGLRLQTDLVSQFGLSQPYLKANFWHNFANRDVVIIQKTGIETQFQESAIQVGGGIIHNFSDAISVFAVADYTFDVQGEEQRTWMGNAGAKARWG